MRRLTLVCLMAAAWAATPAHAGLFDDEEARRQIADLKAKSDARADQQAKSILDLANQNQRLAEEVANLRGLLETLIHKQEVGDKRAQDFYLDLDTRLRKFEAPAAEGGAGAPAEGAPAAQQAATPAADPAREGPDYEAALNFFKAAKYKEAAVAFSAFMQKYPGGQLAPNAQYWLGNAWYAQRDCKKAIEAQTVVTTKYADSPKAPDAWMAIATCQQEMGNAPAAKRSLEAVLAKYPNTPAADAAKQRLKK